ncbi:hypothetical protein GY45DRAFT_476570 [Cubamyces sp. BRFM 1775]|nr:hypothetical protein GY45DRAFT_476570 [Cubamyces sp. BRFM 1775]
MTPSFDRSQRCEQRPRACHGRFRSVADTGPCQARERGGQTYRNCNPAGSGAVARPHAQTPTLANPPLPPHGRTVSLRTCFWTPCRAGDHLEYVKDGRIGVRRRT